MPRRGEPAIMAEKNRHAGMRTIQNLFSLHLFIYFIFLFSQHFAF